MQLGDTSAPTQQGHRESTGLTALEFKNTGSVPLGLNVSHLQWGGRNAPQGLL